MKISSGGLAGVFLLRLLRFAAVSLALVPCVVSAGLFGPSTYEECIAESMQGVQSDVAAREIIRTCRKRFPSQQADKASLPAASQSLLALPSSALDRLQAKFEYEDTVTGRYIGELYNGNSDWQLRKLVIRVHPRPGKNTKEQAPTDYAVDVVAAPLTKAGLTLSPYLPEGTHFQWEIVSAQGSKVAQ
jgi:hypothetical protein